MEKINKLESSINKYDTEVYVVVSLPNLSTPPGWIPTPDTLLGKVYGNSKNDLKESALEFMDQYEKSNKCTIVGYAIMYPEELLTSVEIEDYRLLKKEIDEQMAKV